MSILSRFFVLLAILLGMVGCQTEPKISHELASESDIREKIVGTWTGQNYRGEHLKLHFDAEGAVLIQRTGTPDIHAFWRMDRSWLVVSPKGEQSMTSDDFWGVWHIDDHELIFQTGFSTGGQPERFTR